MQLDQTQTRGSAMTLPAALSGFFFFILMKHMVQSQSDWGVTYSPDNVCAVEGATVELTCTYRYPSRSHTVIKSFWFTKEPNKEPLDLKDDPQYANRVTYSDGNQRVRITNVKKSDSAVYKFRLITNRAEGKYTGAGGVTLFITVLQVHVKGRVVGSWADLTCQSSCQIPQHLSYVWYQNGQTVPGQTSRTYSEYFDPADSYSCALSTLENFPSPPVCGNGNTCNRVIYTQRTSCAPVGSSVDISCTFISHGAITSKFWFRSRPLGYYLRKTDLSEDSQYSQRVMVDYSKPKQSTLRISGLTESDATVYRFKFTAGGRDFEDNLHGTSLTVTALQVQVIRTEALDHYTWVKLRCHSSCSEPESLSYVWFRGGWKVFEEHKSVYEGIFFDQKISCALQGYEEFHSPSVYAPKTPSVLLNTSAVIVENSSVTLTCSTDANPAANFTWFKKSESGDFQPFSNKEKLIFSSVKLFDAGEYYCTAKNEFSRKTSEPVIIDVKYAPKVPAVSVNPVGNITEGHPVTLSCKSDANPAASITWYKDNQTLPQGHNDTYNFTPLGSEDSGVYYCKTENEYGQMSSKLLRLDVQYSPRHPTVSQNPSVDIMEGSTVELNCSCDANPAAKYSWYKINRDTPVASGQIFTITDIELEHSGNYYCQAHNSIGHKNSTSHSLVVVASMKSVVAGSVTAVILILIFLPIIFLFVRKKKSSEETSTPRERADIQRQVINESSSDSTQRQPADEEGLFYASIRFSKNQDDPIYSNVVKANSNRPKHKEEEEDVEYSEVTFKRGGATSESRYQSALEDASALYSAVARKPRVRVQE